jgi:pimeloyl-ACP methyl ester carboxylesterase
MYTVNHDCIKFIHVAKAIRKMPIVHLDEQDIFYAARKLDNQPVLLLLHGAGGSHLDWPPQLRRFEPLGSCAIDLPGHGRSAGPARPTVGAYADVVLNLIRALKLSEVILVGHSMGGAIALEIALRHPEEVIGLILVATGARLRVNKALLQLVDSDFGAAVDHLVANTWGPKAEPGLVWQASQLIRSCDPETMHMDFAACNEFDIMAQLGDVTLPTLVLVGTEDRMTPLKFGQYLAENIARAEFVPVEGAGHMLAMEQSQLVGEAIGDFIDRRLTNRWLTDKH